MGRTADVLLLGSKRVGKTALLTQLQGKAIDIQYQPTEVESSTKQYDFEQDQVTLNICEIGGKNSSDIFSENDSYNASVFIFVYDINKRKTFEKMKVWFESIKENFLSKKSDLKPVVIIVGNKTDLKMIRTVTEAEGQAFAKDREAIFFEASAYENENVDKIFKTAAETFNNRFKQSHDDGLKDFDKRAAAKIYKEAGGNAARAFWISRAHSNEAAKDIYIARAKRATRMGRRDSASGMVVKHFGLS